MCVYILLFFYIVSAFLCEINVIIIILYTIYSPAKLVKICRRLANRFIAVFFGQYCGCMYAGQFDGMNDHQDMRDEVQVVTAHPDVNDRAGIMSFDCIYLPTRCYGNVEQSLI